MRTTLVGLGVVALLGCGAGRASVHGDEGSVERGADWTTGTRARIDRAIATRRRSSAELDAARPPVVVLDWDNTTMRGDIGDLSFAHALETGRLRRPADWSALEPLTASALAAAARACEGVAPGDVIPATGPCAEWLAHVALGGALPSGEPAFVHPVTTTSRASYAFLGQLFAGLSPEEIGTIGREAFDAANARPVGTRATVGGVELEHFARVQPPVAALARELSAAGFEVWVVSASHEAIVRAIAGEIDVRPEHVIGLRPRLENGRYVHGWEDPTGGLATAPIITFHEGKRAWIQHVIFGLEGAPVLAPHPVLRPSIALGDADTDLAMLESATELAILFDRHRVRVTCHALAAPERFAIEPLFVAPPPPRTEPYPCSTYVDELGPILGPDGAPLPDRAP